MWNRRRGKLELQPSRQQLEKSKNIQCCHNRIFSNLLLLKIPALNSSAIDFLNALGRRISSSSGEERESLFLFQRISITMQRFNAILLHNCFVRDDPDL